MRKFKVCIICQDICWVCKYSIDIFFGPPSDYTMAEMLMQWNFLKYWNASLQHWHICLVSTIWLEKVCTNLWLNTLLLLKTVSQVRYAAHGPLNLSQVWWSCTDFYFQMHGPVQEAGIDAPGEKKSNTPSPFEGHEGDRVDEKQENLPANGLLQNGLDEEYR